MYLTSCVSDAKKLELVHILYSAYYPIIILLNVHFIMLNDLMNAISWMNSLSNKRPLLFMLLSIFF